MIESSSNGWKICNLISSDIYFALGQVLLWNWYNRIPKLSFEPISRPDNSHVTENVHSVKKFQSSCLSVSLNIVGFWVQMTLNQKERSEHL